MREILHKRGELTTKQLVTLIILIVSFIIVLILIFRLNLGETTNAELCRNSVALREQSKIVSGPLDCKTSYVCISGGGNCQGTISETIEVDLNREAIMNATAEQMAECWWMFGEGKVKYGGNWLSTNVHYALCSIIQFDSTIQAETSQITYSEFYGHLRTTQKSSSQTYLQYFYSTNNPNELEDSEYFGFDLSGFISTSGKYSVFTGIDNNLEAWFIGNDDNILNTFIIPTEETSSRLVENSEFITKA
jgi:hypothetical protein